MGTYDVCEDGAIIAEGLELTAAAALAARTKRRIPDAVVTILVGDDANEDDALWTVRAATGLADRAEAARFVECVATVVLDAWDDREDWRDEPARELVEKVLRRVAASFGVAWPS